jgi:hypothetical protein
MTRWNRRSERSHELTPAERAKGGYMRAVRLWKRRYQEAREELELVRRTVETTQPAEIEGWRAPGLELARPAPQAAGDVPEPAASESQASRGLSVAERDALRRGLTGPPWWADTEARAARREARRRDRFQTM